jgi:phytanoyl-CoA hydroxylase
MEEMHVIKEEHLKAYEDKGYFILESFFTAEEIEAVTAKIDLAVEEHNRKLAGGPGTEGISRANEITFTSHLVKKNPFFQDFCAQSKFVELTTRLLGPDVALYWDQAVYKQPETNKDFPWHQDNGYGSTLKDPYVTCWIALEDATVENGCIWVMPESHKQGIVEHRPTPIGLQCYFGEDPGIPVPLKKGSMVVFSSLLFHRSGPNLSNSMRKGYIVQYFPTYAVNQKTGGTFKKMVIAKNGVPHLDASHVMQQDHMA